MKIKSWSTSDAAQMMEVPKSYVTKCIKNKVLETINGRVTQESLDKYFEDALFTPSEAADALQIELGIIEDCIKDGFLPTYQAWHSTRIRGKDLDKLDDFITAFLEQEERAKTRDKRLQDDINNRAKWVTNSQGNLCFICKSKFLKIPEYWLNRENLSNGSFELHAVCIKCYDESRKSSNN